MTPPLRVPFTRVVIPFPSQRPLLPVEFLAPGGPISADALVDSGADTNVLPWDLGVQLGCDWANAMPLPSVGGALSSAPARGVALTVQIGRFPPTLLAFAWVQSNAVPVVLGQTNFFLEFDVCFYASRGEFTVAPRTP